MQIDTVVTDLDDTLLDANTTLTPYTLKILNEAKRRDIRVIPASGRAACSMRSFVDQLNTGQPYIACNGAQLMNSDHTEITSSMFTPAEARELVLYFQSKGFYTQIYRGDNFYFAKSCEANRQYSEKTGMKGEAVGDLAAFLDFPTPKILSMNTPQEVDALFPIIQSDFPEVSFTISKPYFLEAQPKGVSKGSAIKQLSKIIGFSPEHTMVFGDSLNDISMFDFTEYSVAIANARGEVIKAARYVTERTNAQDGLAHFIHDHVFPQNSGSVNV